MSGIIGKKIGMTSIFDASGRNVPCTVIEAGPCVVTQIKTKENDGYDAIQMAYDDKKEKNTSKAEMGHYAKAKTTPKHYVTEFTGFEDDHGHVLGSVIKVDAFTEGEYVDIVGQSKGKGFQGVVTRYNFQGVGGTTHGQANRLRHPGSLGASSYPSRVFKGMRMAGQLGGQRVKVINLEIIKIVPEKNLIIVKGSVPGASGSYLIIERWS